MMAAGRARHDSGEAWVSILRDMAYACPTEPTSSRYWLRSSAGSNDGVNENDPIPYDVTEVGRAELLLRRIRAEPSSEMRDVRLRAACRVIEETLTPWELELLGDECQ